MIEIPEEGWGGFAPSGEAPLPDNRWSASLLGGAAAALDDGHLSVPADGWGMIAPPSAYDPVIRADGMRERAGAVFQRQRAVGGFNRELDELYMNLAEDSDWTSGLERFDRRLDELRHKHGAALSSVEDRDAFERHAEQFGAMQRIGLKRALVERQHSDALSQLDTDLGYYAGKAASAPNPVFRQIAVDSGLKAIAELRDAGYLFPEGAQKLETAFRQQLDGADLEAITKADPDNALALLDDTRLFPNAGADLRAKLKQVLAPAGEPSPRDNDDIAQMPAPLVENNDGLRELVGTLEGNPDDPGTLIQLASNLLDGGSALPEANRGRLLELLLRELLRRGGDLGRRPRDPDRPTQLPPPKQSEEPLPLPPATPRRPQPRAEPPLVEPPKEGDIGATPTYSPTKPIGAGEDRYKKIGNKEFVQYSDGTIDFGRIDESIAQQAGIREAPVRLPKGDADSGELHLEIPDRAKQLQKAGYPDAASFVDDVSQHFTEIWEGQGNSLMLVFRPNADSTNAHTLFISLQPSAAGDAYEVVSGGVFRGQYPAGNKRNLLWHGARSSP